MNSGALPRPSTFLVAIAIAAVLGGGAVTPASAAAGLALDGASLPHVVATPETVTSAAASGGMIVDPAGSVLEVDAGGTARSSLTVDASALPSDAVVTEVRLEIVSSMAPDGGDVQASAATPAGSAPASWGPAAPASPVLTIGADGAVLDWVFTVPGDYELVVRPQLSFLAAGASVDAIVTGADVAYRFLVAEPAPDAAAGEGEAEGEGEGGDGAGDGTAPELEEAEEPPGDAVAPEASVPAPGLTVFDAGVVDLSNQWADENLMLRLVADGAALDPAAAVLGVPAAEVWPGAAYGDGDIGFLFWELLVPSRGDVWRTAAQADSVAANPLLLRADAHGVSSDRGGELFMSVADALLPENGEFTTFRGDHGAAYERWHSGAIGDASKRVALWPDAESPNDVEPLGFAFTAPGRYCITVQSEMLDAETGLIANARAALTFAVGIDPATVEACPQPAPAAPYDPTPIASAGGGVIDSGLVHLSPRPADDGTLELDLNRVAGGRTTTYAPDQTIFSVPERDDAWPAAGSPPSSDDATLWSSIAAPGTRLWRTAGSTSYTPLDDPGLPLTLAPWADSTLAEELRDSAFALKMVASETPGDGYLAGYQTADDDRILSAGSAGIWDSRPGGRNDRVEAPGMEGGYSPFAVPYSALGLAFTAPGRYCVTVELSGAFVGADAPSIGYSTLTFAVGIDPGTIEPCAQGTGGDGSGDPGDDPYDDLDPTVTWFHKGHLDIGPKFVDGELRLHTGNVHDPSAFPAVGDAVWVGRGPYVTFTVPETTPGTPDYSLIGPAGSTYYGFSGNPAFLTSTLWPGLTHEGLAPTAKQRKPTWTLLGVTGPEGGEFAMPAHGVSSRDLPASFAGPSSHQHLDWAFTEQGVYCLNFEVRARDSVTGADHVVRDQLTVAIGDSVDLHTVQPCSRTAPDGAVVERAVIDPNDVSAETHVVAPTERIVLTPHLGEGDLKVAARAVARPATTSGWHEPESLVFGGFRNFGDSWRNSDQVVDWSGLHLPSRSIQGDLTMRIGAVDGPGTVSFEYGEAAPHDGSGVRRTVGTRDGESREVDLWPGFLLQHVPQFSAPGVYCVPLTWSATLADGDQVSTTRTLTYAVGVADPASVTACADGGGGTDPGDGQDPGDPVEDGWDVPNGTRTESGATILNAGHVDIASVLAGDALDTKIKDTTASSEPIWRDPVGTVLQVNPAAGTVVPDLPDFAFLGPVDAPTWVLPETQDDALLWPGWSTEAIAADATRDDFRWTLADAIGPGEFALFQMGVFGTPEVMFNTRDGITAADSVTIEKHVHAHGTWAFSAEGVYCLAFERATALASGQAVADSFTLAIAVGRVDVRKVDPAGCFTDPIGTPGADDTTPIADDELTDATRGTVTVLGGTNGFTPGQLVTVQLEARRAGEWVSVWLHSEPRWLGWAQVGASGAIQTRLPADAAAGGHRLVVEDRSGSLLGWDSLSIVAATTPGTPAPPPQADGAPPTQTVAATQCVAGATILSAGHVDYASRIVGGRLESLIGDDTSGEKVYREPAGTVLWLKPSSAVTLPGGYGSVGAPGSTVWQSPQSQNPNLVWLGWNTEALNAGNASGPLTWTLDSVSGPGAVRVYLGGPFGGVQQMVFDNGGTTAIALGVHAHANWAFTAEGIYRLQFTQSVTLANGQRASDTETLTVVVGDVDPTAAITGGTGCGAISNALLLSEDGAAAAVATAAQAEADATDAVRKVLPGIGAQRDDEGFVDPFTALAEGNPVPLLLGVLGLLLLLGATGGGVFWWRKRRAG